MATVRQFKAWHAFGEPEITFDLAVASGNAVVVVFPNSQDSHPFGPAIPTDDMSGTYVEDYESGDILNMYAETMRTWVFSRRNITDGPQTIRAEWADSGAHLGQCYFYELEDIDNSAPPSDALFATTSSSTSKSISLVSDNANAVGLGCAMCDNGVMSGSSPTVGFEDENNPGFNFNIGLYEEFGAAGSQALEYAVATSKVTTHFGIVYEAATGGGGTTYPQSVGGTLSFTGGLVKRTGKNLSGALSFAGALVKRTSKALIGSISPSGAIAKRTLRNLAGALSFSGAMTARTVFTQSLTAALSLSGGISKRTMKGLSGALSFSGGLVKRTSKGLSGVLSFSGALISSIGLRQNVSGALSFAGTLATLLIPFNPSATAKAWRKVWQGLWRDVNGVDE